MARAVLPWLRLAALRADPGPACPRAPDATLASPGSPGENYAGGPDSFASGMAEIRALAEVNTAAVRRRLAAQGLSGAANGLLLLSWLLGWWIRRNRMLLSVGVPPDAQAGFQRLARSGARLGRAMGAAETPREYAAAVIDEAAGIAGRVRRRPQGIRAAAEVVSADAARLVDRYERVLFGPEEAAPAPARPTEMWPRLWAAFRRLWWIRVTHRRQPTR